jgi:hypothetical protein
VTGQGRVGQDERGDQVGACHGDLEGHAAARGGGHQRHRSGSQPLQERDQVPAIRIRLGRQRRAPEATQVQADRLVGRRERRPLRLPHAAVADPGVDEDDRGTLARNVDVELHARKSSGDRFRPRDRRGSPERTPAL